MVFAIGLVKSVPKLSDQTVNFLRGGVGSGAACYLNEHFYKMDTLVERMFRVSPCLSLLRLFYSV